MFKYIHIAKPYGYTHVMKIEKICKMWKTEIKKIFKYGYYRHKLILK